MESTTYQVFDVRDGVSRRIAPTTGRGSEWESLAAATKAAARIAARFGQYGSSGRVVETATGATVYDSDCAFCARDEKCALHV